MFKTNNWQDKLKLDLVISENLEFLVKREIFYSEIEIGKSILTARKGIYFVLKNKIKL
jgi:hypothetical protein